MSDAINIQNLIKQYKTKISNKVALDNISFRVAKGKFFALLGPNGAGKSTLINIIANTVIKDAGLVEINGYNIDTHLKMAKRSIGIVPQEIYIDPFFSCIEYLLMNQGFYGIKPNKTEVLEILDIMGIKDKTNTNTRELSGGMKRRLLIAKAMIHEPDILILDEPTAGVDIQLRKHLWSEMLKLKAKGKTIILTTHYLEEAEQLCDEIAIINKGKLILIDNTNNLMNKMGSKILEIVLDKPLLKMPESLKNYTFTQQDNTVIITYHKNEETGQLIAALVQNGYVVNSVQTKNSSLEDIFISLTQK